MSSTTSSVYENPLLREVSSTGDLSAVESHLNQWRAHLSPSELTPKHLDDALVGAVRAGQAPTVSFLLDQGAQLDPDIVQIALGAHNSTALFQTFLDHGWDINAATGTGAPALKHLISDEATVRWFLALGASPTVLGSRGESIIGVAAAHSTPAVVDLLLAHGAVLRDSDCLHAAAANWHDVAGRIEMIKHLLTLGMNINAIEHSESPPGRCKGHGTLLHSAVYMNNATVVAFLLENGADRDAKNTLGQTPLEYGIAYDSTEAVELLRN